MPDGQLSRPLGRLRFAGLAEGTTLLLLIGVAVPLKHLAGWPQFVTVMGPIHGFVFLAYVAFVIESVSAGDWRPREAVRLAVAALLPFGTFVNDRWIRKRLLQCGPAPQ